MAVEIRPTTEADLDRVMEIEHTEEAARYLTPWERERHVSAFGEARFDHLVITNDGEVDGFLLIDGVDNESNAMEVRKIAAATPGRGVGRAALELALVRCFEEHGAHRVWLDLKLYNERARKVYESAGFVAEGTMRECYLYEGAYESLLVMSILEQEWRTRQTIRRMYERFNAREVDACLALMRPDVDWDNAFEGGRLSGRDAVAEYWRRQWAERDTKFKILAINELEDGRLEVRVHITVNDLNGDLIGQGEILHIYTFGRGLVARLDIEGLDDLSSQA